MSTILAKSAADLNLDNEEQKDHVHKSAKASIPLHENLPREKYVQKAEPTLLKEIAYVPQISN